MIEEILLQTLFWRLFGWHWPGDMDYGTVGVYYTLQRTVRCHETRSENGANEFVN